MHTHANARLMQKGRMRLIFQHLNDLLPWKNSLQKQGFLCAVLTNGWPVISPMVRPHWLIDAVFAATSGGRLIRSICSAPSNCAVSGSTCVTSPGCSRLPSPPWPER